MQSSAQQLLRDVFGFDDFRPGQGEVIELLMSGQPVLAVMPTGAGKSLCYQIPALLSNRRSIIISPLTALMDDQVIALESLSIPAVRIHSGRNREENIAAWRDFHKGTSRLLYLSPERLMSEAMLASLQALDIGMFVVDEAHCISKWGVSFRPEYEQLGQLQHHFPGSVISGFTATADAATRRDISAKLTSDRAKIIVQGFDRPNLHLAVQPKLNWKSQLLEFIKQHAGQNGIVYCLSRKQTEETEAFLRDNGINALAYHAGMDAAMRRDRQNRFMSEEGMVMAATIAFGMGIDKPDIRFVMHVSLPGSMEAYYQEIGRAGRDGLASDTLLLFGLNDMRMRRQFIDEDGEDSDHKFREQKRLDSLIAYCEGSNCRRQILLRYFDEDMAPCGNCDNCLNPPEMIDGTINAQKLLSAIFRTQSTFGQAHVIDVVRGTMTPKIKERGHDQLKTFGVGQDQPRPWWQVFVRQMLTAGHIRLNIEKYGRLEITSSGTAILKGEAGFEHRKIELAKTERKTKVKPVETNLSGEDAALLSRLKAKRLEIARQQKNPAFTILTDAVLLQLATIRPQTKSEFATLNGVGPSKLKSWASIFLAVVNDQHGGNDQNGPNDQHGPDDQHGIPADDEGISFDNGVDFDSYAAGHHAELNYTEENYAEENYVGGIYDDEI